MPDIFLADGAAASSVDRCHSLRSLLPPPAALPSLPTGYNSNAISGFTATQSNNGRLYRCIITDGSGNTLTSNEVKLNTTDFAIYRNPSNVWGILGDEVSFSVRTYSTTSVTYQWQYSSDGGNTWKNSPATGNKTNTLTGLEVNDTRLGLLYRCKVTDENGTVLYSNIACIQLKTDTWTYTYDANGMRTKRTDGYTTYEYIYDGGSLSCMTVGNDVLNFAYDSSGAPMSVRWNGSCYYYVTNIPGDITSILNNNGTSVVEYVYDSWGNILSITGSCADTLGKLNPLTYRGYIYDAETQLYYLQSRYYDPNGGRFINADDIAFLGASGTLLSNNLFAYCENSPIMFIDRSGYWAEKYSNFKPTDNGFRVNYSSSFTRRNFCISFADDLIKNCGKRSWWYGYSYKKMNSKRIAKELYGHAVLYCIGVGLTVDSSASRILNSIIRKFSSNKAVESLTTIIDKINYIENKLGLYLFEHSKVIDVNNNEKWYRMIVFNLIWSS